jgi:hypothetical protein
MRKFAKTKFSPNERALARELSHHENQWVALSRQGSRERVVASGYRISDVKREVDIKGIVNPTFRKIPSSHKTQIALVNLTK